LLGYILGVWHVAEVRLTASLHVAESFMFLFALAGRSDLLSEIMSCSVYS